MESDWVRGEVELAREHFNELKERERFIVYRRHNVSRSSLPVPLQDFVSIEDEEELIATIKRAWGIHVVIPAAGQSSGLYPLNEGVPKVLLPIGEKPILHHILQTLQPPPQQQPLFSSIEILAGYFKPMIEYYAGLVPTRIPIKVDGASYQSLSQALKALNPKRTFLLYFSDIVLREDANWGCFIHCHRHNREDPDMIGTLMVSCNHQLLVGRIKPDPREGQLIGEFKEKPEDTPGYLINMAVSIFEPEILNYMNDDDRSFFGDTIPRALKSHKSFCHYGYKGKWEHIQTLNDWLVAQEQYLTPKVRAASDRPPSV